jgi:hypothetical protein
VLRIRCLRKDNFGVLLRRNRRGLLVPGTFHGPMVIAQPLQTEKRCNQTDRNPPFGCPESPFGPAAPLSPLVCRVSSAVTRNAALPTCTQVLLKPMPRQAHHFYGVPARSLGEVLTCAAHCRYARN